MRTKSLLGSAACATTGLSTWQLDFSYLSVLATFTSQVTFLQGLTVLGTSSQINASSPLLGLPAPVSMSGLVPVGATTVEILFSTSAAVALLDNISFTLCPLLPPP